MRVAGQCEINVKGVDFVDQTLHSRTGLRAKRNWGDHDAQRISTDYIFTVA